MSRTVDAAILTAAQGLNPAKEVLVEITGWGGTDVRWCLSGVDLEFPAGSGTIYDGRRGTCGALEAGGDTPPSLDLTVDNADYAVRLLIGSDDPRGCAVTVAEVWVDPTTRAVVGTDEVISGVVIGAIDYPRPNVTFGLRPAEDERGQSPPVLWNPGCPHAYKGTTPAVFSCGYSGGLTTCDRTWDDCVAHANTSRYGGADMAGTVEGA